MDAGLVVRTYVGRVGVGGDVRGKEWRARRLVLCFCYFAGGGASSALSRSQGSWLHVCVYRVARGR